VRRWLAAVLVVCLLAALAGVSLALLGDSDEPSASPGVGAESQPPEPGSTDPPTPELAPFYGQELTWEDCGDDRCASLEVPLDYADPAGETLEIAVLARPAGEPSQRLGAMVVNPGGPGEPGTSYAARSDSFFRDQLTDRFDVVGFDPRGTGDSSPVDCLTDEELDAYVAGDPDPAAAEEVREYVGRVRRFGRGCSARSGEVVGHVTTVEAARDMDVLRSALGEDTLAFFGASYGTQLGATYAELFPDRVGRLVLDGAVDLTLSRRDLGLQQAAGFQTALEAYVQNCLDTTESCFLGDSLEDGLARIEAFLDQVEQAPIPAGGGRELHFGNAFYGIITPLYERDYWALLSQSLKGAFEGDGSGLMLFSDAYTARDPLTGGYLSNRLEANLAISCLDDPDSLAAAQVPSEYDDFDAASPTFGRAFAWSLMSCQGFRERSNAPVGEVRGAGAAPILVVGTTRDPATPVQWARALADQLDSGVLVTRDGDGHTGYNAGNECLAEAVEDYLIEGVVPEDGLAC
jgi:pimeloyl-ACP methyl ester carboxylesterase